MMKVVSHARGTSVHHNGDLVSSSRYSTRKIAPENPKTSGPKVVSKPALPNISVPRCVLRDKTNNLATNVKFPVYSQVEDQKLENKKLCSVTNPLSNSISVNPKQAEHTMKKNETSQNEGNADVYEFVLDEGEVNENRPKGKTKKCGNKRKRVQRKIIDSPEEVLPTKKNRKPLLDKVSKNFIPESIPRNRSGKEDLNLFSVKPFSDDLPPAKLKTKSVHFNGSSRGELTKSISDLQMKFSTPKCITKHVDTPKNVHVLKTHSETSGKAGTRNLLTSSHPSSLKSVTPCTTGTILQSSPSASECDRLDSRMKEKVSTQLLTFFSAVNTNSRNNYTIPVEEKTPAKQMAARSFRTDVEHTGIGHSENIQSSHSSLPSVATVEDSDKTQNNLDVSNCFGFDDDADSGDEDFSPAKTFTKSSHKLGKFQCSTPKDVGQKNGASQPFRFPALSIVKKRKFLEIAGNTPATVTNKSGKIPCESSDTTLKRKPCMPANFTVKESTKPAIFDQQDEDQGSEDDEKCEGEHQQLQVTLRNNEGISSPQKKVVQKSYGTPRHMTRLRRPVHSEVKEDSSDDEAEEILLKRHKKTHRPAKNREADEWAKDFNSMCETIDSFELIVE